MMRSGLTSQRIPASEILHIRDLTTMRAGQVHGVPALAPVLLVMRDLADWEDAEILRKKTESCLAAIVVDPTGASNPNGDTLAPKITDAYGNTVEQFQPGMVAYGNSGFDVKFNTPSYAGGYEEYKRSRVRDIAIGLGWIYELLSGDQSQTNYSSYRAGLLGVADRVESLQYNIYIPQLCEPVWEWFVEAAVDFAGLSGDVAAQWTPNAFDLLDREAEAKADGLMLSNGTMTWPQAVARQGYDPEKQLQEIETWKPRLDKAGVSFNPKQGGANGQNQTASPAA
jgi:lambda family phage portal protein